MSLTRRSPKPEPSSPFLRSMIIHEDVLAEIATTIGAAHAERGGALIGDPTTGVVTNFIYDVDARSTGVIYEPNTRYLNSQLPKYEKMGRDVLGIVHSHPPGLRQPSLGDLQAAYSNITSAGNPDARSWFMPIVQSAADVGAFEFLPFIATCDPNRSGHCRLHRPALRVLKSRSSSHQPTIEPVLLTEQYARVSSHIDFAAMIRTTVIVVGVGAGGALVEQLARLGIKRFFLFDPDVVDAKNLVAQNFRHEDIGAQKVDALARRLGAVEFEHGNGAVPPLEVFCGGDFLKLSDDEFSALLRKEASEGQAVVALYLSDSHAVQARGATLALQYRVRSFWVGVYRGGGAAELIFWDPEFAHLPCYRCIVESRYQSYERTPPTKRRPAVSSGLPFTTTLIDAICGHLVIGSIHLGDETKPDARLYQRLVREERNFAQLQTSPDYRMGGEDIFAGISGPDVVTFVSLFQQDGKKVNCPDCGSRYLFRQSAE